MTRLRKYPISFRVRFAIFFLNFSLEIIFILLFFFFAITTSPLLEPNRNVLKKKDCKIIFCFFLWKHKTDQTYARSRRLSKFFSGSVLFPSYSLLSKSVRRNVNCNNIMSVLPLQRFAIATARYRLLLDIISYNMKTVRIKICLSSAGYYWLAAIKFRAHKVSYVLNVHIHILFAQQLLT